MPDPLLDQCRRDSLGAHHFLHPQLARRCRQGVDPRVVVVDFDHGGRLDHYRMFLRFEHNTQLWYSIHDIVQKLIGVGVHHLWLEQV